MTAWFLLFFFKFWIHFAMTWHIIKYKSELFFTSDMYKMANIVAGPPLDITCTQLRWPPEKKTNITKWSFEMQEKSLCMSLAAGGKRKKTGPWACKSYHRLHNGDQQVS